MRTRRNDNVDWAAIRELCANRYRDVFTFLGLEMVEANKGTQLRCTCPVCTIDRALVYTIEKRMWGCWGECKPDNGKEVLRGDLIRLVAHVRGIKNPEAAALLQQQFMREPEKPQRKTKTRKTRASSSAPKVKQERVGGIAEEYGLVDYLEQFA